MRKFLIAAAIMAGLGAGAAHAATMTVHDPANDIIQNYLDHHAGTPAASLDIREFTVELVNGGFLLDATFNGSIEDGLPGDWVLGVDVGPGANHPFGAIGAPNVLFDKALIITKDFQPIFNGHLLTATPITNNGVVNEFRLSFDASLFAGPTTTLDPSHFGFNLWSRDGSGGINSIADFAPNNSTLAAAPESTAWALMIFGFGMAGATLRGRRKALAAG